MTREETMAACESFLDHSRRIGRVIDVMAGMALEQEGFSRGEAKAILFYNHLFRKAGFPESLRKTADLIKSMRRPDGVDRKD